MSAWDPLLRLLREKLPMVRVPGGGPAERVYHAELEQDGQLPGLRIVTYRGTVLRFSGIREYRLEPLRRDRQGVPVAYRLELSGPEGRQELELYL